MESKKRKRINGPKVVLVNKCETKEPEKLNALEDVCRPLTYHEARRLKGPLYDVLILELYEAGCPLVAEQFECIVKKERELFEGKAVQKLLSKNETLLLHLFELAKTGEQALALRDCSNIKLAFQAFYDGLELLNGFPQHRWLIDELYPIAVKICGENNLMETIEGRARIYLFYAKRLAVTGNENSLKYFNIAFFLTQGAHYKSGLYGALTLHKMVAFHYTKALVQFARHHMVTDPSKTDEYTKKANYIAFEGGLQGQKLLHCELLITRAEYLLKQNEYHEVKNLMREINRVIDTVETNENIAEFKAIRARTLVYLGICNKNCEDYDLSLKHFENALKLSKKIQAVDVEAEAHMELGNLFIKYSRDPAKAQAPFLKAKRLYIEMGDGVNKSKIKFLIANAMSKGIFSHYIELIKSAEREPCYAFDLHRWKNVKRPFWENPIKQWEQNEFKHCLPKKTCAPEEGVSLPELSTSSTSSFEST